MGIANSRSTPLIGTRKFMLWGALNITLTLTCPLVRPTRPKIFCTWTSAWCHSFRVHFENHFLIPIVLAAYIDDFFGGPISTGSLTNDRTKAKLLLNSLIHIGNLTSTFMNKEKCAGPRRCLEILGHYYNAIKRTCSLPSKKQRKYIHRLASLRQANGSIQRT